MLTALITAMSVATLAAGSQGAVPVKRPAVLTSLLDCQFLTHDEERLRCFDRQVAALATAEAAKEVVIVDREQIQKTRRSVFGLALPNLGIFGDSPDLGDAGARIEGTIKRAWITPNSRWNFEIDDGARWVQIDSRELIIDPKPGHSIIIRRAAMGSYFANVNRQTAIRVRRFE